MEKSGIKFSGFKPPARWLGKNLINVLNYINTFSYVCISSPIVWLKYENKNVSNIYVSKIWNLLNIPTNISLLEDLSIIYNKIDFIYKKGGVIVLQWHYNDSSRTKDCISEENILKLEKIIKYLEKYENIKFLTLNEIISKNLINAD